MRRLQCIVLILSFVVLLFASSSNARGLFEDSDELPSNKKDDDDDDKLPSKIEDEDDELSSISAEDDDDSVPTRKAKDESDELSSITAEEDDGEVLRKAKDKNDELSNKTEDDANEIPNKSVEDYDDDFDVRQFVDNRIDETPTYVSPVEQFVKVLTGEAESGIGRFISGITKPIRDLFDNNPAGRAVKHGFGEVLNAIGDKFKAIYPGTEWCGAGDVAKSPDDVGLFALSDSCCRAHDQCKDNIEASKSAHGLRNNGIFTRSNCECDEKFYDCLKNVHFSIVSMEIGVTYFNILRPQCFKLEHPAQCSRYASTRFTQNKCLEYDYDKNQTKVWQWFDNPDF